jgi:DNA helicase II / ATP-dependent DNA helicase PcrA
MPWKPPKLELTDDQNQAVYHDEGPILVVAGAGTGKTTVLASRIVRLIEDGMADPSEILAVTYTRNSARDLLKRIARLWKGGDDPATITSVAETGLKIGTFHAYCYKLLREAGQRFDLIDDNDLYVFLRRRQEALRLHYYVKAATPGEFLDGLTDFFRRCHDELRTPDDYDKYVAKLKRREIPLPRVTRSGDSQAVSDEDVLGRCEEIARVFRYVEDLLAAENLGTYGHVITRAIAFLRDSKNAEQLKRARKGAKFLLIDEFQDSNVAQIELARLLAGEKANVFAVGDPDQAIYRFRGATAGTFDHFLSTFGVERVKRVTMSGNRRSTDRILRTAYSLISHNPQITSTELPDGKRWEREPLQHMRRNEVEPVSPVLIRAWSNVNREAQFVAEEISRIQRTDGRTWDDFAVLYRQHAHGYALAEELLKRSIPFTVTNGDLLSVAEVRDMLAALRAVVGGDAVSLLRIAALPVFGIDGEELRAVLAAAEKSCALESSLERVSGGGHAMTVLAEVRHSIQAQENKALAACGIVQTQFGIPFTADTEAFTKFVRGWSRKPRQISGEGTLSEFLEFFDYFLEGGGRVEAPEDAESEIPATVQMETGQTAGRQGSEGAVSLLTVHVAKGLEFPVVFVLRASPSSFPANYREPLVEFPNELRDRDTRLEEDPKKEYKQEERRLFYVAVTRAEDVLVLCARKGTGKADPTPSGDLRKLIAAGAKSLRGCVDFGFLPEAAETGDWGAHAVAPSRVAEWMELPALPQTLGRDLSASAIERYERCPLSYKLALEWKLPEQPAANFQYGSAMHSALLAYFDTLRKGRAMTAEELTEYFLGEFRKAKIDDAHQRHLYERDGVQQLSTFLESPAARPHGRVALLEHSFRCEIAGCRIKGRIDRVDESEDGYVVTDYKTGNPKSQKLADESLQLSIYALAMAKDKPVRRLIFHNLGDNTAMASVRTPETLHKAETKIAAAAAGIAAGEFEPKEGAHCSWCGYRSICPTKELKPRQAMTEDVTSEVDGQMTLWAGVAHRPKS